MQDWDDYGVEWGGPIPGEPFVDTVVVEEINELLTQNQKAELDAEIGPINPSCSAVEELLLNQFSTAKKFVMSCLT